MKRLIFAVLACAAMLMPGEAQGQAYRPYTRPTTPPSATNFFDSSDLYFGFRLGTAFSSIGSSSQQIQASSCRVGLNIGAVVGMSLLDEAPLFLESGLYYVQKGGKGTYTLLNDGEPRVRTEAKYTADFLELPVTCKYVYEVDNDLSVQPFAGIFMAMGTGGKMKFKDPKEARPIFSQTRDNGDDYLRRWDVGLKLGCGFGYDVFYGEIYYDLGLANICHDEYDTAHSRSFVINFGVNF